MWRAAKVSRLYPTESIAHIAVDVCILACLIAKIGGAMNLFGSLFLLPIVLVTVALPPLWVGVYALSSFLGQLLRTSTVCSATPSPRSGVSRQMDPQTSESGSLRAARSNP